LEICLSPNNNIRIFLLNMKHSWTKNAFRNVNKKNDVNGVSLFNIHYLITIMVYLSSQRIPYIQIKYFKFDWSIYRLFVLNSGWKRVSLQIFIFVYVCSTWVIVELITYFETWITINDVNGVSLFNLSYVITIMSYMCS
jgi:hypothetical protein